MKNTLKEIWWIRMRKLLNILYITNPDYYLGRERENVVIKREERTVGRLPIHILEGIVCFNYTGCSPGVVRLCNENDISITYLTPEGRFNGKYIGLTNGNVLLRREQYRIADDFERSLVLSKQFIRGKFANSRKIYQRLLRDHPAKIDVNKTYQLVDYIKNQFDSIDFCDSHDSLRGIEGDVAREYFQAFDQLIIQQKNEFKFVMRSKRPPLNYVNAMLSFCYSVLTYEVQAALETHGLDSYVGFFHTDRPGRASLALDLIEELRSFMVDRFVVSLINRKQISTVDFELKENGAVLLNDKGREKVLEAWQKQRHREITHPFIKEKIKIGLIPYVQAQLLARHIRKDLDFYPPFLG